MFEQKCLKQYLWPTCTQHNNLFINFAYLDGDEHF